MKINIEENERAFQEALSEYYNSTDTSSKGKVAEKMYKCIYAACTNIALSIYKKRGFIVAGTDKVHEVATEATLICMRNILQREHKPEKLSSYCYLRVLSAINCGPSAFDRVNDKIEHTSPTSSTLNDLSEEELWIADLNAEEK